MRRASRSGLTTLLVAGLMHWATSTHAADSVQFRGIPIPDRSGTVMTVLGTI